MIKEFVMTDAIKWLEGEFLKDATLRAYFSTGFKREMFDLSDDHYCETEEPGRCTWWEQDDRHNNAWPKLPSAQEALEGFLDPDDLVWIQRDDAELMKFVAESSELWNAIGK